MRFHGLALAMSAFVLGACAGGDTAATTDTSAATTAESPAPAPAGDVAAAPITGEIVTVRGVLTADGLYRWEPADVTVPAGGGIRFIMESGMPHNVQFLNVPANVQAQLNANIPEAERLGDLATRMYLTEGEEVTISFANIPAGVIDYTCTPHAAMGMNGKITVQ